MKKLILKASLISLSIISLAGCSLLDNINEKKDVDREENIQVQEETKETTTEQKEVIFNEGIPLNDTIKTEIKKYEGKEGFLIFSGSEAGLSNEEIIVHIGIDKSSAKGTVLDTGLQQEGDSAVVYIDKVNSEALGSQGVSQSSTQVILKGVNPEKVTIKMTDGSKLKSLK